MLMCKQNLVKLCPLVLKTLSRNEMVTDLQNYRFTELQNDRRTGQIQYSPTFSKRGYNNKVYTIPGRKPESWFSHDVAQMPLTLSMPARQSAILEIM